MSLFAVMLSDDPSTCRVVGMVDGRISSSRLADGVLTTSIAGRVHSTVDVCALAIYRSAIVTLMGAAMAFGIGRSDPVPAVMATVCAWPQGLDWLRTSG